MPQEFAEIRDMFALSRERLSQGLAYLTYDPFDGIYGKGENQRFGSTPQMGVYEHRGPLRKTPK